MSNSKPPQREIETKMFPVTSSISTLYTVRIEYNLPSSEPKTFPSWALCLGSNLTFFKELLF